LFNADSFTWLDPLDIPLVDAAIWIDLVVDVLCVILLSILVAQVRESRVSCFPHSSSIPKQILFVFVLLSGVLFPAS
jgi:uncharacterized integral membrane protein